YEAALKWVKRNRASGIAPDAPPGKPRGPHVALKRKVSQAIAGAIKSRRIRQTLSVLHPQFSTDPYPLYHRLRAINPIRRDPLVGWWVVTGFAEVTQILRDRRFSSLPRSQRTASGTMELETLPAGPVRRQLASIGMVLTRQV